MRTPHDRNDNRSPMLTLDQVAEILVVDERTVRRYCTNGDLEYVKFGHNTLRFKPQWIDEMIERKQGRHEAQRYRPRRQTK